MTCPDPVGYWVVARRPRHGPAAPGTGVSRKSGRAVDCTVPAVQVAAQPRGRLRETSQGGRPTMVMSGGLSFGGADV